MKTLALKLRAAVAVYLKWGWPIVLVDAALVSWAGEPAAAWRSVLNDLAFLWVLCAPVAPLSLLLDRGLRERVMARLCGLREGDERERAVTGEAARATLLFGLALQSVLLVLTLVSVRLAYDPALPKGSRGTLEVGMSFSSARHLDPFGAPPSAAASKGGLGSFEYGGYLLSPSSFPVLALLLLVQLAAFKAFALRRYEGADA